MAFLTASSSNTKISLKEKYILVWSVHKVGYIDLILPVIIQAYRLKFTEKFDCISSFHTSRSNGKARKTTILILLHDFVHLHLFTNRQIEGDTHGSRSST